MAGLEMYGTASSHNHELVSSLGATPIDYRTEDLIERILALSGDGVDAVFDPIGGAKQIWRSYRALRKGGRLVWFGMAATAKSGMRAIPLSLMMIGLLKLIPGCHRVPLSPDLGQFASKRPDWYREPLAELFDLTAEGWLKPVIAERIPLLEAARAHELLDRGGYAGKVVVVAGAQSRPRNAKAGFRHSRLLQNTIGTDSRLHGNDQALTGTCRPHPGDGPRLVDAVR